MQLSLTSHAAMEAWGAALSKQISAPAIVYMNGNLGAGKTTLVRGFLRGLGHSGAVKSPTYTIVESYSFTGFECFHFDLYRMSDPEELEAMGIRDYMHDTAICMIEWPELGNGVLPEADIVVDIEILEKGRCLTVHALNSKFLEPLSRVVI